ncbi:MAG: hypothetical protein BWY67_00500 [Bacteroidetes bacterium ADurb.Bin397]|nr:MAG: hypothetical protein BWY67_00500 [Bacteroidetes bacterium ADurb.Bin397]
MVDAETPAVECGEAVPGLTANDGNCSCMRFHDSGPIIPSAFLPENPFFNCHFTTASVKSSPYKLIPL